MQRSAPPDAILVLGLTHEATFHAVAPADGAKVRVVELGPKGSAEASGAAGGMQLLGAGRVLRSAPRSTRRPRCSLAIRPWR